MDLFEILEDEFDELFGRLSRPRRQRVVRVRPDYFETLDDEEFRSRFRLTKTAVSYVVSLIEHDIKTTTNL